MVEHEHERQRRVFERAPVQIERVGKPGDGIVHPRLRSGVGLGSPQCDPERARAGAPPIHAPIETDHVSLRLRSLREPQELEVLGGEEQELFLRSLPRVSPAKLNGEAELAQRVCLRGLGRNANEQVIELEHRRASAV